MSFYSALLFYFLGVFKTARRPTTVTDWFKIIMPVVRQRGKADALMLCGVWQPAQGIVRG